MDEVDEAAAPVRIFFSTLGLKLNLHLTTSFHSAIPGGDETTSQRGPPSITRTTTQGFNLTLEVNQTQVMSSHSSKTYIFSSGTLGSPSKMRPTSVIASKNTRKRMEDRHVVLHDLKAYLPSNLQSKATDWLLSASDIFKT